MNLDHVFHLVDEFGLAMRDQARSNDITPMALNQQRDRLREAIRRLAAGDVDVELAAQGAKEAIAAAATPPIKPAPVSGNLTTDASDPRLGHGHDDAPVPQNPVYLVLSEAERAKGFIRPVRTAYFHTGLHFMGQTRDLTDDEKARFVRPDDTDPFVLVETRTDGKERFWAKAEYEQVGKGCATVTTMGLALSETYARDPKFYGSTYCVKCAMHRPVREFRWLESDGSRGPTVGS